MYIKKQLDDELKRDKEIKERGERIQRVMDSMADVVTNKDKELERKQERDYIQQCIDKDEAAHLQDLDKKQRDRNRAKQLNEVLSQQMKEKQMVREGEQKANASFMHRWVETMDKEEQKRSMVERKRKEKMVENQGYLKSQIEGTTVIPGKGQALGDIAAKRKHNLGGLMDPEEAKMNRELLKDIAKVKRGEAPSLRLQQAVEHPF